MKIDPAHAGGTVRRLAGALVLVLLLSGVFRETPASPPPSMEEARVGGAISGEVTLSGRVRVTEDLLVPAGSTLVLSPGTVLSFDKEESSKVDPEYFFGGTEIVVRGTLRASEAEFRFPGRTGGIVVDGGRAHLSNCRVSGGEAGISVLRGGRVEADGPLRITDCRVGVAFFPDQGPAWIGDAEVTLRKNAVAVVRFAGAPAVPKKRFRFAESEEADLLEWEEVGSDGLSGGGAAAPVPGPGAVRFGDTFLDRDRTVDGDAIVDGIVRIAPGATLTIRPGSRIFFTFRDTNGDGIGENGIFLQGSLNARGTREKPIGFYPVPPGGRGRWDSINFMASESGGNVLEHVEIAGAYRGLHAHFSTLKGREVRISDCFRGIQFQESEVDLANVAVSSSSSAIRCRDSNVRISGLRTSDTVGGANFLRSVVRLDGTVMERPGWYGIRFRECRVEASDGTFRRGFVAVSAQEGTVRAERFAAESAGLAGFAWQEGDVRMTECRSAGSLLDGMTAAGGTVEVLRGSITGFGRYAVKLGGPADVVLRGVGLGAGQMRGADPIYDGHVAKGLGIVRIE